MTHMIPVPSEAHRQTFSAEVVNPDGTRYPLEVEDFRLSWDERRAPRAMATLVCAVPDRLILDEIDPRTGTRVEITAGYILPGGAEEATLVADLGLRTRRVGRPADTMTLELAGDEALVIDASPVATLGYGTSAASVPLVMQWLIRSALSPDPDVNISHPDMTDTTVADISDRWASIADLADVIDAECYDDGLRGWHIDRRPTVKGASSAILRVGPGGGITDSEASLDRDEWANHVALRYRWRDATDVDRQVIGTATTTTGPFATATAGLKIFLDEREVPATQASANAAAKAVLSRFLSRSRSYQLTAIAHWWLRPGHTVTVQLPTGVQERHLVVSVEFTNDGLMTVTTRLPDKTSTIGE